MQMQRPPEGCRATFDHQTCSLAVRCRACVPDSQANCPLTSPDRSDEGPANQGTVMGEGHWFVSSKTSDQIDATDLLSARSASPRNNLSAWSHWKNEASAAVPRRRRTVGSDCLEPSRQTTSFCRWILRPRPAIPADDRYRLAHRSSFVPGVLKGHAVRCALCECSRLTSAHCPVVAALVLGVVVMAFARPGIRQIARILSGVPCPRRNLLGRAGWCYPSCTLDHRGAHHRGRARVITIRPAQAMTRAIRAR